MALKVFLVIRKRGSSWNSKLGMREQEQWPEHAAFMNRLAENGFVTLGGPVGNGSRVLLIVRAENERAIRNRLDQDPWTPLGLLPIQSIDPWEILLGEGRI